METVRRVLAEKRRRGPAASGVSARSARGIWRLRPSRGTLCNLTTFQERRPSRRFPDMAKGKRKLEVVQLVCEETGDQNYTLRRKTGGEKLKVKKYSPRLRKHTVHNEKRK